MSCQKNTKSFNFCLWFGWFFSLLRFLVIPVGIVVDLNTTIGNMAMGSIKMAQQDFYKNYPHYQTRLNLRIRDSQNDLVTAASAAFVLMMNEKVHAIIGPLFSEQARFIIHLGHKYQVPIVSFSATSPSLSSIRGKYFIRTAQGDRSQMEAIAAVVEAYGWHEIIPIYEDTEYGNGLIPYLTDALEEVNTRVPYRIAIDPNSEESKILAKLKELNKNRKRIFLVHMTSLLGPKFFSAANKAGMMNEAAQPKPLELEVFNVAGLKERVIGQWSPQRGLFHDNYWSSREKLKAPIWPGDTTNQPTKLRIGFPGRKRLVEFLKVEGRSSNSTPEVSGFAIDVFLEVVKAPPFPLPYEFVPFQNKTGESTSYEELVLQIEKKVFDAVVGDITIVASRAEHVDFTLPFSESGVSMVVSMKQDERQNMWIFLKPLSPGLWLTTGAAFVLTGIIIWLHECRTNSEFQGSP